MGFGIRGSFYSSKLLIMVLAVIVAGVVAYTAAKQLKKCKERKTLEEASKANLYRSPLSYSDEMASPLNLREDRNPSSLKLSTAKVPKASRPISTVLKLPGSIATVFTSSREDTLAGSEGEDEKQYFDVVTNNYLQRTITNETKVDSDDNNSVLIDVEWKEGQPQLNRTFTRDSGFLIPRYKNNVKIGDKMTYETEKRDTIIRTKIKSFLRGKTVKQYEKDKKLKKEMKKERKEARKLQKSAEKDELRLIYSPQELTRFSVESSKKIWNVLNGNGND